MWTIFHIFIFETRCWSTVNIIGAEFLWEISERG